LLIPVGEEVSVPVTIVVLGPEPEVVSGLLRRLDVDTLHLEVGGRAAPLGTRLIVTAGDRVKLPGRVLGSAVDRWVVSREGARPSDDRAAPRFATMLEVRWRVAAQGQERWVGGGPDPGPFVAFQGPADLSLSGLCFGCDDRVPPVGSHLLLDLRLGPDDRRHRAIGAVRRIETEADRTQIGVEFVDLPEATFDALSDYTLRNL
jgi:hypothetical protein